jgi:hypothetical protein
LVQANKSERIRNHANIIGKPFRSAREYFGISECKHTLLIKAQIENPSAKR